MAPRECLMVSPFSHLHAYAVVGCAWRAVASHCVQETEGAAPCLCRMQRGCVAAHSDQGKGKGNKCYTLCLSMSWGVEFQQRKICMPPRALDTKQNPRAGQDRPSNPGSKHLFVSADPNQTAHPRGLRSRPRCPEFASLPRSYPGLLLSVYPLRRRLLIIIRGWNHGHPLSLLAPVRSRRDETNRPTGGQTHAAIYRRSLSARFGTLQPAAARRWGDRPPIPHDCGISHPSVHHIARSRAWWVGGHGSAYSAPTTGMYVAFDLLNTSHAPGANRTRLSEMWHGVPCLPSVWSVSVRMRRKMCQSKSKPPGKPLDVSQLALSPEDLEPSCSSQHRYPRSLSWGLISLLHWGRLTRCVIRPTTPLGHFDISALPIPRLRNYLSY